MISTLITGSPPVVTPTRLHAAGTNPITAMPGQTTGEAPTNRLTQNDLRWERTFECPLASVDRFRPVDGDLHGHPGSDAVTRRSRRCRCRGGRAMPPRRRRARGKKAAVIGGAPVRLQLDDDDPNDRYVEVVLFWSSLRGR
jgi:hypothetical protein